MLNAAAIWKHLNSPRRLFLIAGPCVIENEKPCRTVAAALVQAGRAATSTTQASGFFAMRGVCMKRTQAISAGIPG